MKHAVHILRSGGLVAFPTETVYGLGADASNAEAVKKIFAVKERPTDHPLIVHIADISQLSTWARSVSPEVLQLAATFWPGPLTLVLHKQPQVLDIVTGRQDTVGIRIPRHVIAQQLLREFGGGIAAPSANKFTHLSPTNAAAVYEELGDAVDLILDGANCEVGLESTILDMSAAQPVILRPGIITAVAIESVLHRPVISRRQDVPVTRAPGMHHVHYAPRTRTELVSATLLNTVLQNLAADMLPVAVVLHSAITLPVSAGVHVVRLPHAAPSYAHALYNQLRLLDHGQYRSILIEAVPQDLAWEAIADRLQKASCSR